MVKRKNQVLIDSDSSDSEGSGSDLESVSLLLDNLLYCINLSSINKSASIYGLHYLNLDLYLHLQPPLGHLPHNLVLSYSMGLG